MLSWAVVKFRFTICRWRWSRVLCCFDVAALPGIIIGLLCTVARGMSPWEAIVVVFHFLIPAVLCWGGYRILCRAGSIFTMVT